MAAVGTTSIITSDPEVHHGDPCFAETRVPLDLFFAYIEAGDTIQDFLDAHPTVTRQQVDALLQEFREQVGRIARR